MKKLISTLLLCISTITFMRAQEQQILVDEISYEILKTIADFQWDAPIKYDTSLNQEVIEILENADITIVLGTWCSDSHYAVGQFINYCEQIGYDASKIKFIGLDESKQSPSKIEVQYDVTFVPTFIITNNKSGKSVRIIENLPTDISTYLVEQI